MRPHLNGHIVMKSTAKPSPKPAIARPRRLGHPSASVPKAPRLTLRLDLGPGCSVGPGKVRLLEGVRETGSILQAGRALGMSYRRAWLLADELNGQFGGALIAKRLGGAKGGGASLTPLGEEVVSAYRDIERMALKLSGARLKRLMRKL